MLMFDFLNCLRRALNLLSASDIGRFHCDKCQSTRAINGQYAQELFANMYASLRNVLFTLPKILTLSELFRLFGELLLC